MTVLTSTPALAELSGTYTLDTAHTQIGFVARHAMVTKVRGAFDEFSGTGVLDGGSLGNSTVTVVVKTASINTRNAQRDAHLRSSDFLAVDEYPEITFVSTGSRQVSATELELTGDLTIKGVTRSATVPFTYEGSAQDPYGNLRVGFEGAVTINRTDYGITWNAALETACWSARRSSWSSRCRRSRTSDRLVFDLSGSDRSEARAHEALLAGDPC
jgi:polyisoprenoid-binding protein YceI